MKTDFRKMFFLGLAILALICFVFSGCGRFKGGSEAIHIAVTGSELKDAVNLYFDEINGRGGIDGKKIVVDYFDDQNDPKLASEKALEISEQSRALAVIGHYYSSCSISAGPVYEKHGVPAITPTSAVPSVIRPDNEWYFRTAIDDTSQGRFLADYAKVVLKQDAATIIYQDGFDHLADVSQKQSDLIGIEIKHKRRFGGESGKSDEVFEKIVGELISGTDDNLGIIFIPAYIEDGHRLVKTIRDMGIRNPIIGSLGFCSQAFFRMFEKYPEEIRNPGFYTKHIYAISPLLFDTASMEAQEFREKYKEAYGKVPSWENAFAYDTAMLLHQAIKQTGIAAEAHSLKEGRKKIRDHLAGVDRENPVQGLNGPNYFDENGNVAGKQLSVGIYRNGNIISAPGQLRPLHRPELLPYIEEEINKERIVVIGDDHMYKTHVVYSGVEIRKIEVPDFGNPSCLIDFLIWFRFQGEIDAQNIEFQNALDDVKLERLAKNAPAAAGEKKEKDRAEVEFVREEKSGDITSRVFRVRALFRNDFLNSGRYSPERNVGFRFSHRELDRNHIIYVTDNVGMGFSAETALSERIRETGAFDLEKGWNMEDALFFQDTVGKSASGHLRYIGMQGKPVGYSRFNFKASFRKDSLTGNISLKMAMFIIMSAGAAMVLLLSVAPRIGFLASFSKPIWFLRLLCAMFLLVGIQSAVKEGILRDATLECAEMTLHVFHMLHWLVPAVFLHLALNSFVWEPMEKRSGHPVPKVLRHLAAYLIYFAAGYAIIVFALGLNINKLMAASGTLAMVVGLLVKDNITNYFASVSIFQGREIRIGHWVKIGDFEEGRVEEITRMVTRMIKRDGSMLSVPNSVVLNAPIENYSHPDDVCRLSFDLETVPEYSPARVRRILEAATLATEWVLNEPAPLIVFNGQGDSSAKYTVHFFVRDYERKPVYLTAAWESVWIHLEKAGIELATPHRIHHLIDETPEKADA